MNNIVEQEHRAIIKRITRPMLGFKAFRRASLLLGGIDMITKWRMQRPGGDTASAAQQFRCLAA